MTSSCFSLISLFEYYLRRHFTSSGLSKQAVQIDSDTTISFWGPNSDTLGAKPSLVLLHGFGPSSIWQWPYQVKILCPYYNIYVPDLIFFGGSTSKSSERSEVFQAVSMGKLLEKLGVKSYSVMGTSYGGFVAYNMAKLFEKRVEKVILASSAMNRTLNDHLDFLERAKVDKVEDIMLPNNVSKFRTLLGMVMFRPPPSFVPDFLLNGLIKVSLNLPSRKNSPNHGTFVISLNSNQIVALLKTLYSGNLEEKSQLLTGLTFGHDDQVHVSPLQQEVLVIWGEHDQIFPIKKAIELKEILGDKARLEVVKDTSHTPQVERPKEFNKIVVKFLLGKDITSICLWKVLFHGGSKKEKAH